MCSFVGSCMSSCFEWYYNHRSSNSNLILRTVSPKEVELIKHRRLTAYVDIFKRLWFLNKQSLLNFTVKVCFSGPQTQNITFF